MYGRILAVAVTVYGGHSGHPGVLPSACLEIIHPEPREGEDEAVRSIAERCAAAGPTPTECAFLEEVLALQKDKAEGFSPQAFCDIVHSVVDCTEMITDVVTSTTVLDLIETNCLKRNDDPSYCAEVKANALNLQHNDDAHTLWQCYKAKTSARAEEVHRTHAEVAAEATVAEAKQDEEVELPLEEGEGIMSSIAGYLFAIGLIGSLATYYYRSRPRIVSFDEALITNEGYNSVLDQYSNAYA
jgi:hypothetical protein